MKLRLAGTLVLALGVAALASAPAYAGNGQGNGKGQEDPAAPAAVSGGADDHGNSANAPGQLKKDDAAATGAAAAAQTQPAVPEAGMKPSNDTAHDTHAPASSDQTKLYGNGKTAGQIAIGNGAAPSTVLHGPGNSQPHKAAPCSGGHEVDVHALKGKRGKACGGQPPTPHPTPDPGKPGNPVQDPGGNTPGVNPSSPAQSTPAKPKPVVSPQQGSVEKAAGVLSATQAIGAGTLPFTGFPIWVVVLLALALIVLGLMLRRRSRVSSS
jgi:hypothetical protein